METQELYRGRLIDHIQLVVADLDASRRFYQAVFQVLGIPIGGMAEDYFWADELFVSTADSKAAQGQLTGRHHLAFQAKDRAAVDVFTESGSRMAVRTTAHPASAPIIPDTMRRFCLILTATISRPSTMVSRIEALPR